MLVECFIPRLSSFSLKNEDFDQLSDCIAPKRWSKYTTFKESSKVYSFKGLCLIIFVAPSYNIAYMKITEESHTIGLLSI